MRASFKTKANFSVVLSKHKINLNVIELDNRGFIHKQCVAFPKTDFCIENGLQMRDLRHLESTNMRRSTAGPLAPCILSRGRESILLNLAFVRAIIRHDRVKFFDAATPSSSRVHCQASDFDQQSFSGLLADLQEQTKTAVLRSDFRTFEFTVLECILDHITQKLTLEIAALQGSIDSLLHAIERDLDRRALKRLLLHNKELTKFLSVACGIRSAIEDLLQSDTDMEAMYLSRQIATFSAFEDSIHSVSATPSAGPHDELELLLEHFLRCTDEIIARAEDLAANIQSTEDISNIVLDSQRNTLLRFELRLQIAAVSMGLGTLIAGVFGMNLLSTLEHRPSAFLLVSSVLTGVSCGFLAAVWAKMSALIRESQ